MSTQPNTYALIKNNKVFNIVLCEDANIQDFSNSLEVDSYVLLTDENFFNKFNKAEIDSHYLNEEFYPKSWIIKEDGNISAPKDYPTDGRVYRWYEDLLDWMPVTPYPSWTWDEENNLAIAPVQYPEDGKFYIWNEESTSWVESFL
jgi:hypothetical protein